MAYPRYKGDPYFLTARYNSKCAGCGQPIKKGDRIFWYPKTKDAMGERCGCAENASADFECAAFDEMVYAQGYTRH